MICTKSAQTERTDLLQPLRDLVHPSVSSLPDADLIQHVADELTFAREWSDLAHDLVSRINRHVCQ